jgi:DNA-binding transcriptional regulator YhcF (GntR family)
VVIWKEDAGALYCLRPAEFLERWRTELPEVLVRGRRRTGVFSRGIRHSGILGSVNTRDQAGYSATRPSTTARDLERTVLIRIATGQYGVGQRIPTCTELGRELGANKNTVSKAYQALSRQGYIVVSRGHGTFVAKQPRHNETDVRNQVAKLIEYAVVHASRGGIEGDELYELVREVVDRVARSPLIRVGFVDCNRPDATRSSSDLAALVGCSVEPLTLEEVLADDAQLASQFDVLGFEASHQSSLTEGLLRLREDLRPEVLPILSMPSPESILQVAALPRGTRLGIVADMPDTIHSLLNMARAFNAGLQLRAATSDDVDELRDLLASVDTILVTHTAEQHVAELALVVPMIHARFRIDGHSADALAERIAVLSRARLALGRPNPSGDPTSPRKPARPSAKLVDEVKHSPDNTLL